MKTLAAPSPLLALLILWTAALGAYYLDRVVIESLKVDLSNHKQQKYACAYVSTTDLQDVVLSSHHTVDDAVNVIDEHGMAVIPDILTSGTVSRLRDYLNATNHDRANNQFYVQNSKNRFSTKLSMHDVPILGEALGQIAEHPALRPVLDVILGPDPALLELTAITSRPGAEAQGWHQDIMYEYSETSYPDVFLPMYSLFLPLQDTTESMGATGVCPGTHVCVGVIPETEGEVYDMDENCIQTPMTGGSALLYNSQLFHRGEAHTDPDAPDRIVLILTLSPSPLEEGEDRVLPIGSTFSLAWNLWGHTMDDLSMMLSWRFWHSLGPGPWWNRDLRGYGLIQTALYHIANNDIWHTPWGTLDRNIVRKSFDKLRNTALSVTIFYLCMLLFDRRQQIKTVAKALLSSGNVRRAAKNRILLYLAVVLSAMLVVTATVCAVNEIYIESFRLDYEGHDIQGSWCDGLSTQNVDDVYLKHPQSFEEAEQLFNDHGMIIVPDVIANDTATKLRDFINATNYANQNNQFFIHDSYQRFSTKLGVNDNEHLAQALKQVAEHPKLRPLIDRIMGPSAAVVELCAITNEFGAVDQEWHGDTNFAQSGAGRPNLFLPLYTLIIALQDTTEGMGATGVCPGTHTCAGTEEETTKPRDEQYGMCYQVPMARSSGMLYNMQMVHRGSAHVDPDGPARVMLFVTFGSSQSRTERRRLAFGPTFSLRWDMFGHVIDELSTIRERPWRWWHALGVGWVRGYSMWHVAAHHIANGSWFEFRRGGFKFDKVFLNNLEMRLLWSTFIVAGIYLISLGFVLRKSVCEDSNCQGKLS